MTAAIVIDAWKLSIFKRHLTNAGHTYTEGPGVTQGTLILKVETADLVALGHTVRAANTEAIAAKQTPASGRYH